MTALKNVLAVVSEEELYGWFNPLDGNDCWIFYGDGSYYRTCYHDMLNRYWKIEDGVLRHSITSDNSIPWPNLFGNDPESIDLNRKMVSIIERNIFEREIMEVNVKKYIQLITSDAEGLTVRQLKESLENISDSTLVTLGEGFVAHKIAKTYITEPNGDTQVFLEIYDEKP